MDLHAVATTYPLIFFVELPDKTFVATLVLAARFRPLWVWIGVGSAFFVQTLIAVVAGQVTTLLPRWVLLSLTLVIFCIGAVVLLRTARSADESEQEAEQEYAAKTSSPATGDPADPSDRASKLTSAGGLRAAVTSFVVLFTAEWGDLSQLLTIGQVARTHEPISVFVGAWAALLTVSGLAVLAGRLLLRYLRLEIVHYIGATVCLVLAVLTLLELTRL